MNWIKLIIICAAITLIILAMGCTTSGQKTTKEECQESCQALGQEYFSSDYSTAGFGDHHKECWCKKENNDIQEVW